MARAKKTTKKTVKEEVKKEVVVDEALSDGDVIDRSEPAEEVKNDTVVVCSNFPRDIIFKVKDNAGKDVRIKINGNATNLRGLASGILPAGAYGTTFNVPAEAWEQINCRDDARIKQGLIFASTPNKARKEAKERKDLRNGFEPIDPTKIQTKPNEG